MNLEFILGLLISALATAGTTPAVSLLQSIHDKNPKQYRALVYVLDYGLSEGADLALKTATKVDDETVAALQAILRASATQNGITL